MTHAPRALTLALTLATALGATLARAQDWPLTRRDAQRVAFQPMAATTQTPGELARVSLGGGAQGRALWVRDADEDGVDEVFVVVGGRVASYGPDGTLRWATPPLGFGQIHGFTDVDADGRMEIVASALRVAPTVLDALTGRQLATLPVDAGQATGEVLSFRVGGQPALLVSEFGGANGGHATARVVNFAAGFDAAPEVTPLDTSAHGYWYGLGSTTADVDGDGRVELVALDRDAAVVYDLASGASLYRTEPLGDFPFGIGRLHARDVDGDGRDEVVVLSNNAASGGAAAKRIMLLELEGATFAPRWELRFDPSLSDHRFVRNCTGVLRDGALPSVVTTALDPASGRYQTFLFRGDSTSASPYATLDGRALIAISDVDRDGVDELITVDTTGGYAPPLGTLRVLSLAPDGSFTQLASLDAAALALAPTPFVANADTTVGGGSGPWALVDTDGDRRPDALRALMTGDVRFSAPAGAAVSAARTGAGTRLWLTLDDGAVAAVAGDGTLLNDASPPDGRADLVVATYLSPDVVVSRDATGPLLAAVGPGGFARVYRGGTGLSLLWTTPEPVASPWPSLSWVERDVPRLAYLAREQTGELSLVMRRASDGSQELRVTVGTSPSSHPLHDVTPLDASASVVTVGIVDRRTNAISHVIIDVATGTLQSTALDRTQVGGEYPPTVHDRDGDGRGDIHLMQARTLKVVDGRTGVSLFADVQPRFGGMMSFVDVDDDGVLDAIHQGGFGASSGQPGYGLRRLSEDLGTEVWSFDQSTFYRPVGIARGRFAGVHFGAAQRRSASVSVLDANGAVLGSSVLAQGTAYPDAGAADAAGAAQGTLTAMVGVAGAGGDPSFVLGSTDGYLYGLRASDGGLRWSLPMRAEVGEPVPAQVLSASESQLLVPTGDGLLRVLGTAALTAPAAVYDDDGVTPAGSAADDLDELHVSDLVGADWPAVDRATGYEATLLREDGFTVVPWVDVGATTVVRFEGLSLEAGVRYVTAVRAYRRGAGPSEVSTETLSDGFVVIDDAPPTGELALDPPLIFRSGEGTPDATHVTLVARDAVSLASYALWVEDRAGTVVRGLAEGVASGVERRVELDFNGRDDAGAALAVGRYRVAAEVADGESATVRLTAELVICGAGADPSLDCDTAPDAGVDAGSDGGVTDGGSGDASPGDAAALDAAADAGTLAGGGGCGCRVTRGSRGAEAGWLFAALLGALCWRRRRARAAAAVSKRTRDRVTR